MAILLVFFSTILYTYITYNVDKQSKNNIIEQANYLFATYDDVQKAIEEQRGVLHETLNIDAYIGYIPIDMPFQTKIYKYKKHNKHYIEMQLPYRVLKEEKKRSYISIRKDITDLQKIQSQIYNGFIFVNILSMGIIIIYAFFISGMLTTPIKVLNKKLSMIDETMIDTLDTSKLPKEFETLGKTLNNLLLRINNFIQYKKELFIGSAHELKTPLAVMKTKNQVTLLKKNQNIDDFREAIEQNVKSIDEMNKIVTYILEYGRAEGAQLESSQQVDVMKYLKSKAQEFSVYAKMQEVNFTYDLSPAKYIAKIQTILLTQILQNFVQNAIRFTPKDKRVLLRSYKQADNLIIEVIDEGSGIDENKDYFAPFVRSKESQGVGLGLFLAQSAASALRAKIELKNREDRKGAIARLTLQGKV
jgi:two-component system OmpR family sensor kinase